MKSLVNAAQLEFIDRKNKTEQSAAGAGGQVVSRGAGGQLGLGYVLCDAVLGLTWSLLVSCARKFDSGVSGAGRCKQGAASTAVCVAGVESKVAVAD
jgi:hypothetical protein